MTTSLGSQLKTLAKHKATKGTSTSTGDVGVDVGQIGGSGEKSSPAQGPWAATPTHLPAGLYGPKGGTDRAAGELPEGAQPWMPTSVPIPPMQPPPISPFQPPVSPRFPLFPVPPPPHFPPSPPISPRSPPFPPYSPPISPLFPPTPPPIPPFPPFPPLPPPHFPPFCAPPPVSPPFPPGFRLIWQVTFLLHGTYSSLYNNMALGTGCTARNVFHKGLWGTVWYTRCVVLWGRAVGVP